MEPLLQQFESRPPEIVFEWHDRDTEARGWLVVNSLRGGAAGGGTRMRIGLDKHEVLSLAKTMEIKFSCCGPPIGGAKSGIDFDPQDPRKEGVLKRWFKAVMPVLKEYYGTGGDLNVDEVKEVIPITGSYGLQHPQEGVLCGHFHPGENGKKQKIEQLKKGVSRVVGDPVYTPDKSGNFRVADLITGFGVAQSVIHYYELTGRNPGGKKALIQGWGNVASAAGFFLARRGVRISGIIDRKGGMIRPTGIGFEMVKKLFSARYANTLEEHFDLGYEETEDQAWDAGADIFIPGAASRLVNSGHLERLKKAGVEVISCGANVPFNDQEIFYGPVARMADENFIVIPDFIANCGMARTFAYLMNSGIRVSEKEIFEDVSQTIRMAIEEVWKKSCSGKNFLQSSYKVALGKIM